MNVLLGNVVLFFFIVATPSREAVESNPSCLLRNTAQSGIASSTATVALSIPTLYNQYLNEFTSLHLKRQMQPQNMLPTDLTSLFSSGPALSFPSQPPSALSTCSILLPQLTTLWLPPSQPVTSLLSDVTAVTDLISPGSSSWLNIGDLP